MNVTIFFKKAPVVILILLCFVISFNYVEAKKTLRLRRVKHVAPRHIAISAKSGNGMYARSYAYGGSIPNYGIKRNFGEIRRNFNGRKRRNGRGVNRTYASRYRNWTPNRPRGRVDKINQKTRKELYPFLKEPPFAASKQKRRIRPVRFNAMQRPQPPKKPDFDEEYFFPEEERRVEKYEFDRPRPKNKRRPEREGPKKPDLFSKIPYYDEKPYRNKNREPVSYSSFVQHHSVSDAADDFYDDSENAFPQPVAKKKKRIKKKKKKNKNKDEFRPFVFEDDQVFESYPPYSDDYEVPKKKRNKPNYAPDEDDFVRNKNPYHSKPISSIFRHDSEFKGTQNVQAQFNPNYSQMWSQAIETTARPVQAVQYQTEHGFQPQYAPSQYSNQYNYNTNGQRTKQVTTNAQTYYSQPENVPKANTHNSNYLSSQASATNVQTPTTNYNYNAYSNGVYSNLVPAYSQPVPSSSPTLSDITIQKSVPIYDNTETFYDFNNNAYVNSQSSKYYNQGQNYGSRTPSSTSYGSKIADKDSESEFIKKHQNLYNKGLSGVPVQGDGYAKESAKKDYDIGYGDFQFDENPNS